MSDDLKVLRDHCDALLLAEVAAWLHDDFKHTEHHISEYVLGAPSSSRRQNANDLIPNKDITLLGITQAFQKVKNRKKNRILRDYLNRCHYAAHIEKPDANSQQSYPAYISSPFGFEGSTIPANLTQDLRQRISWGAIGNSPFTAQHRNQLQNEIQTLFTRVGGDTRRPTNEVLLWDWSHIVASLYKSALAGALLGYRPSNANDLHWRLLSVRVNASRFLKSATRIPDLLARRELLENALEGVRKLLEETYPLATRVYQDENGSIYVVPNLGNLLSLQDSQGKTLEQLIRQEFAEGTVQDNPNLKMSEELMPEIHLDKRSWRAQSPNRNPAQDEIPPVGAILSREPNTSASSDYVSRVWKNTIGEICPVCGLRPQGPGKKAKERHVCDICEQRRADRSQEWATSQTGKTIWNDEVADVNGRLALIVGRFGLKHWLDGTMVQTLVINEPLNGQTVAKNPTFARLRRVWETTHIFWNEVQTKILKDLSDDRRRLKIYLTNNPNNLGPYHAYDLLIGNTTLSVVWVPKKEAGYLISIDNLCYLARQLGAETGIYKKPAASAIFVKDYLREQFLRQSPQQPILYNSDAQAGQKENLLHNIFIRDVDYQTNQYAPAIPILAEPRTFMALVPANKSVEVVKAIKTKYEREMGKVRNRLPLHLGVVYFERKMPLMAVMDAARQMLDRSSSPEIWQVEGKTDINLTDEGWPSDVQLTLSRNSTNIQMTVRTVMGDGRTPDVWYPYWRVEDKPTDRRRWFIGPDGEHWVHVCDLRKGDRVQFTPSTFDFLWLDAAARRFELAYDKDGRRPSRPTRPYLLEDLDRLEKLWETFSKLGTTQIYQTLQTIETRRERWSIPTGVQAENNTVFRQFVADTLANAQWPKDCSWKSLGIASPPGLDTGEKNVRPTRPTAARNDMQTKLTTAAVRGELTDLAELHLSILKEKSEEKE